MASIRQPRYPYARAAFIIMTEGQRYRCDICNISRRGALLKFDETDWLPATFVLQEKMGVERVVEIKWRTATLVGVRFIQGSWSPTQQTFGRRI